MNTRNQLGKRIFLFPFGLDLDVYIRDLEEMQFIPLLKSIMTQASLQLMKTFLKSLNGNDWNKLQLFHIKSLRSLQHLKINTTFLHAAATFWDTRDHVFRFNGQELCPMIKEFAAILGYSFDSTAMITLPDMDMQIPYKLISFFLLNQS